MVDEATFTGEVLLAEFAIEDRRLDFDVVDLLSLLGFYQSLNHDSS
jgi:hypothetical protein